MLPDFARLDELYPSQCRKIERFRAAYDPIRDLAGDFAEFGVGNGGGSRELARLDATRLVWACDTYDGMPPEDYHRGEDDANPPGKWRPLAPPEDLFDGIPNIVVVAGRFAETLRRLEKVRFLMVHLDCDYYESYRQVLEFLETRMIPGGVVFIDDYDPGHNCHGCRRAVDEWRITQMEAGRMDRFDGERIYF